MQLRISDKKNSKLWTAASTMKAISAGDPKDEDFPFEPAFPLSLPLPLPFPSVGARKTMRWQWLDSMKVQNKTICLNMISMEPRSLDSIDPPGKNDNPVWPWPFFILSISVHVFNRLWKARVKKLTANAGWRQWLPMMTVSGHAPHPWSLQASVCETFESFSFVVWKPSLQIGPQIERQEHWKSF